MKSRQEFDTKKEYDEYLKTYFAGLAMQAAISDVHVQLWMKTDPRFNGDNFADVVALNSCEFADALLTELSKNND